MRLLTILILLFLPAIGGNSFAEPERGRLPDGRAFRTDSQGNQLIDYIAELEVSVETLNLRIRSLEEELRGKDQKLARLQQGQSVEEPIRERSLTGAGPSDESRLLGSIRERDQKLAELNSRVLAAETSLREAREQIGQLKVAIERRDAALQLSNEEVSKLQAHLHALRRAEDERKAAEVSRALQAARPDKERVSAAEEGAADVLDYRSKAVEAARERLFAQVEELRRLLEKRDELFKSQNPSSPVSLRPSRPVSSRNRSLQTVLQIGRSATSVTQLNPALRDLAEIRAKIEADIAAVLRLSQRQ